MGTADVILDDIRHEIGKALAARARKRSLGFPEPTLVVLVGNWPAYVAGRAAECVPYDDAEERWAAADLNTFEGFKVEYAPYYGVGVEWRA